MAAADDGDLILVTGGAGFIGSNIVLDLAQRGARVVVCDLMRSGEKWRNLAAAPLHDLVRPEALFDWLARHRGRLAAIVHMGAISSTTEIDIDRIVAANIRLTLDLWEWCAQNRVRLVYASSAATYGDGAAGFEDDARPAALAALRPLNLYGWTKHAFDQEVARRLAAGKPRPPQWVGLKFFNVYGPNEYHKGPMISVVKVKHDELKAGLAPRLFRSDRPGLADGAQARDFIWVGDVVDVMLWLMDTPAVNGLFNLGTGRARSYLDLAHAVCDAAGAPRRVEFIDMPDKLRGQYQSFTEAGMGRLRGAGYAGQFTPLEEGIRRYVQDYLMQADPFA